MTRGTVVTAPTASSVHPAVWRCSGFMWLASSRPMPAPSMPRVAAIRPISGRSCSAFMISPSGDDAPVHGQPKHLREVQGPASGPGKICSRRRSRCPLPLQEPPQTPGADRDWARSGTPKHLPWAGVDVCRNATTLLLMGGEHLPAAGQDDVHERGDERCGRPSVRRRFGPRGGGDSIDRQIT